jgi:hypothetical protein
MPPEIVDRKTGGTKMSAIAYGHYGQLRIDPLKRNQMPTRISIEDRPDLQEIVADVLALRSLSKGGVLLTHRSQRDLLVGLNPQELAAVSRALLRATQPIYQRTTQ